MNEGNMRALVREAARSRRGAEEWFREMIRYAHSEGLSVVKLSEDAGVSRPTIYATLRRGESS